MLFLLEQFPKVNLYGTEFEIRYNKEIWLYLYKNQIPKKVSTVSPLYKTYSVDGCGTVNAVRPNTDTKEYKTIKELFLKACNDEIKSKKEEIKDIENVMKKL